MPPPWGAFWFVAPGPLAVFPLMMLFKNLDELEPETARAARFNTAALACVLTVTSPLFWFNALRPLSDVPGLAVTLAAQAALVAAYTRQRLNPERTADALEASGRMIVLGAFFSALAIGFLGHAPP